MRSSYAYLKQKLAEETGHQMKAYDFDGWDFSLDNVETNDQYGTIETDRMQPVARFAFGY